MSSRKTNLTWSTEEHGLKEKLLHINLRYNYVLLADDGVVRWKCDGHNKFVHKVNYGQ